MLDVIIDEESIEFFRLRKVKTISKVRPMLMNMNTERISYKILRNINLLAERPGFAR